MRVIRLLLTEVCWCGNHVYMYRFASRIIRRGTFRHEDDYILIMWKNTYLKGWFNCHVFVNIAKFQMETFCTTNISRGNCLDFTAWLYLRPFPPSLGNEAQSCPLIGCLAPQRSLIGLSVNKSRSESVLNKYGKLFKLLMFKRTSVYATSTYF